MAQWLRKAITIDKWSLRNDVNFIDLFIYKRKDFFKQGNVSKTIKYYVTGELKRHERINTKFWNFLTIKTKFTLDCGTVGLKKLHWTDCFLKFVTRKVPNTSVLKMTFLVVLERGGRHPENWSRDSDSRRNYKPSKWNETRAH